MQLDYIVQQRVRTHVSAVSTHDSSLMNGCTYVKCEKYTVVRTTVIHLMNKL